MGVFQCFKARYWIKTVGWVSFFLISKQITYHFQILDKPSSTILSGANYRSLTHQVVLIQRFCDHLGPNWVVLILKIVVVLILNQFIIAVNKEHFGTKKVVLILRW